jgi:hypothetical protein
MAWVQKLVCGKRELSLIRATSSTAGWTMSDGGGNVTPPRGQVIFGAPSLSAGGARRTSSATANRDIVLTLSLGNQTGRAMLLRTLRQLTDFFQDAKSAQESGSRDAVYLVRQADEGLTGTILFGRGAVFHEVLAGYLDMPATVYSFTDVVQNNVRNVTLTLTCAPYGVGKPMFLAEAAGWQRFNDDGDLHIWAGTTNLFLNPSFEHATYLTDWAASSAALVTTVEYERVHNPRDMITFQACKLCNTDAALNRWLYSTKTLTAATYALSCYAYTDGSAVVPGTDCKLYAGVAGGEAMIDTVATADPDNPGWYRLTGTFTGDAVARANGIVIYPGKTVIVDNWQLELKAYVTPFALGDQGPGLAFSGTAHNSTTVRTAGQWRMRTKWTPHPGYEVLYYGKGMLSVWCKTEWAGDDGVAHTILDTAVTASSVGQLSLAKSSTNNLVVNIFGSTAAGLRQLTYAVNATTWAASTLAVENWHHVVVTWDKSGPLELWLDGVMVDNTVAASGTWTNLDAFGSYVYVGSSTAAAGQFDGYIADLRIWGPDVAFDSGKTVLDLYRHGRGKSELGLVWTSTIGGALQGTDDASNKNSFYIAGVAGDVDALSRFIILNAGAGGGPVYFALHRNATFPLSINVIESKDWYVEITGGSSTDTAGATRSGGSYQREDSTDWTAMYTVLADARKFPYVAGRYKILAVVKDNAAATGLTTYLCSIAQRVAGGTFLSNLSSHAASNQITDAVYADRIGKWTVLDLGTLDIPVMRQTPGFYGQNKQAVQASAYIISFMFDVSATSVINLDVDYFVFMPADGVNQITIPTSLNGVIDNIANTCYSSAPLSGDITLELSAQNAYIGDVQLLTPRKWVYGNSIGNRADTASDQTPADAVSLFVQAQYRYLWGR